MQKKRKKCKDGRFMDTALPSIQVRYNPTDLGWLEPSLLALDEPELL